jgi:hypothetical protein
MFYEFPPAEPYTINLQEPFLVVTTKDTAYVRLVGGLIPDVMNPEGRLASKMMMVAYAAKYGHLKQVALLSPTEANCPQIVDTLRQSGKVEILVVPDDVL